MVAPDLLNLDRVNLGDEFVTTFNTSFYLEYLAKWPQYCHVITSSTGSIEGYSRFPRRPTCVEPHHHSDHQLTCSLQS